MMVMIDEGKAASRMHQGAPDDKADAAGQPGEVMGGGGRLAMLPSQAAARQAR